MRQETTTRTLYQFDELSEQAKEKARNWFRELIEVDEWSEFVIDDAVTIGALFGLTIGTRSVPLMSGKTKQVPTVYFDISSAQSIEFTWNYAYVPGSVKAVKEYAPQDEDLHSIVEGLQQIQKKNFYQIEAHKNKYGADVDRLDCKNPTSDADEEILYQIQQFGEWILVQLNKEYAYQTSDEYIDESIRINEYEFTKNGEIA